MDSSSSRGMLRGLPTPSATTQQAVVSLSQARHGPRAQNEYVDNLHPNQHPVLKNVPLGVSGVTSAGVQQAQNQSSTPRGNSTLQPRIVRPALNNTVTSSQPTSVFPPLKKEPLDTEADAHSESIVCKKCKKCRCGACTEPRDLPSRWLCDDKCEISLEKTVDACTCFCCVKTVFYHCGSQDEETEQACYGNPCACYGQGTHCFKRWACMSLMALCLPCLWCYWPAKGCMALCTSCYNKCRKKGCECSQKLDRREGSKHSQSRRLLVDSDSSSA